MTEKGEFLGRPVVIIEGDTPATLATSYGDHFKMWVETQTGVLMKAQFTTSDQLLHGFEMTRLQINPPLSTALFHPVSPDSYQQVRLER